MNTHLAKGDVNAAREIFNSPGVAQALTPSLQEDYKQKFRDYDNKQNKFTREYREKVNLYREEFGVEPDARMKRHMMGAGDSKQAFQQAKGLRDAFEKGSSRYRLLEENFGKVKASAENVSPAGDVSLIFAYMKMIDPGSVVRESEFATAQNTGSIPQRLWARYNAALEGERLTKEQRADFKNSAEKLFQSQQPLQVELQERYKNLATMFGIPVEQVVYDLVGKKPIVSAPVVQPGEQPAPAGVAQPAAPVSPPATAPSAADTTQPPSGSTPAARKSSKMAEEQTNTVDEVGGEAPVVAASEPPVETASPPDTAPAPAAGVSPEFMSFLLPGFPRPIELPSNLSEADRAKAINAYLQSDAAKEFIDQDTGAPAFVRAQVGGSPTEDRLANIRRFYPDAAPYDDDNFIYTNPDTGRLTLYNPPGFDVAGTSPA